MSDAFVYKPEWRVLLCVECGFCLQPRRDVWPRHLRQQPHCLRGAPLKALVELFGSYDLLAPEQVAVPTQAVAGLRLLDGFQCLTCLAGLTQSLQIIHLHVSKVHQQKPVWHKKSPLWRACKLQTFFAEKQHIRYFVVDNPGGTTGASDAGTESLDSGEADFFRQLSEDAAIAEEDATTEANIIHGFDSHRSAVVPWLRRTGIEEHTRGLKKDEMHASFAVPKTADDEPELFLMLEVMDEIFSEAHSWCFDGPDCMLTWPRQLALSRFHTAAVGRARGFDPKKEASTLKINFGYWKQCLTYSYRVAYRRSHFTTTDADQRTPECSIQLTAIQEKAWGAAFQSAVAQDRPALRDAMSDLSMALICHPFGGSRYHSPLLSFCAMLSVKPYSKTWKEPGNYNSCLSGVIWAVQLIIFHASASLEKAGLGETLERIEQYCGRFLKQDTETPMGEILGWRLLLFTVSKEAVGPHQAQWDVDEKILTYRDVDLHMDHVPRLLLSEFQQAQHLLYDELMFGAPNLPRLRAWALKDNLDADAFGWFFGQHRENVELLKPLAKSLLTAIQGSKPLRDSFIETAADGSKGGRTKGWRTKAIERYEAVADEFLKRLLVLVHMGSGQPLRESELFSVTWRNTQRRRNVYLKHGLVMLHTTYHKGQQQMGKFKDNIRFLPASLGDLLLDYVVFVVPLRQVFLRHSAPHAVLSPYVWWKDGKVWPDNRLTRCMEQACSRASIPRLHIANWRQITVNIVKTKFATDVGCFEVDDGADDEDAEEIEADIRVMTKQRNHSTRTVNRAYANQYNANFGNVWDGLIRQNLRASTLWKDLWGLDQLLEAAGKRKRGSGDVGGPQMLKQIAMGVYRPRTKWAAAALLKGARKLYRNAALQWKCAAQERAMATVMSWTEQVVVVMATGEGKSLLFMLPCVLPDAGVTILVLPLVSLRGDLLRRVRELGIGHLIWEPGEQQDAPLVFVTVEAAGTEQFRTYAHRLAATQALGRIVVDEAHLTVTASDYRQAMVDLALIRSVRTQFVYLTATLPPAMQAGFEEQNHLVSPKVIRASTNRRNLFYRVQRAPGPGGLLEEGARRARDAWHASGLLDQTRDKIILYVQTRDEATELAELLRCPVYTAKVGTAAEKEELLRTWLATPAPPYIVATSALSAGFDYAHVRLVLHLNEPDSLVAFAQESGRAGRDGKEAYSVVLLPPRWVSQAASAGDAEKGVLHRYLQGQECRRACLSAYLDLESQLRQCVAGEDVTCDVCSHGPVETALPAGLAAMPHTGSAVIQRQRRGAYLELSRYKEDLLAVRGTCLLCRGLDEPWDHALATCHRRFDFSQARDRVRRRGEGAWIAPFQACYWCYNPQAVCARADPASGCQRCADADVVLPLCYSLFCGGGAAPWLQERFQQTFTDIDDFLTWCGRATSFGGGKAIWAVRVAAAALVQMELY
jgi:superfamily II DNA or RNA helicase